MTSDSDRKAAEEYAQRVVSHEIDAARFAMRDPIANARADFLAGVAHALKERSHTEYTIGFVDGKAAALKELEQVAREAFEAGRYGKYTRNSIMPRPLLWSEVQHDFDYKEFEDYWQQKTESKEAND
ncbi:MAG: hypothetical protein E6Q97_21520 [Desulfurellales bacterium]|nr:MAG: hypothetical protein E6Q97_21520 [Desulfurellales bacterium]